MKRYVVGFLFDSKDNVLLLRKQRPLWQKGFLNGVGGHVEEGESFEQAMVREFEEEAGVLIPEDKWTKFAVISGVTADGDDTWEMACFRVEDNEAMRNRNKLSDVGEGMAKFPVSLVTSGKLNILPNLRWLVPMGSNDCSWGWPYKLTENATLEEEPVNVHQGV